MPNPETTASDPGALSKAPLRSIHTNTIPKILNQISASLAVLSEDTKRISDSYELPDEALNQVPEAMRQRADGKISP